MTWSTVASSVAAVALHAALLVGSGVMPVTPPEYGVEVGDGIELELVAAPQGAPGLSVPSAAPALPTPLESVPAESATETLEEAAVEDLIAEAAVEPPMESPPLEMIASEATPQLPASMPQPAAAAGNASDVSGDGSSPFPGRDATTLRLSGGARSAGTAKYLRNPAPRYPHQARDLGQEGIVLVRVDIDSSGRPERVELAQSSGFPLLDQSAVEGVRRWRFLPAHVGGLPVGCTVEIPVRFVIEQS